MCDICEDNAVVAANDDCNVVAATVAVDGPGFVEKMLRLLKICRAKLVGVISLPRFVLDLAGFRWRLDDAADDDEDDADDDVKAMDCTIGGGGGGNGDD